MVTPETNTGPVGAQAKIGSADNFWLWSPENGFDLSRTQGHDVESSAPLVHLKCEISNVVIDPAKTALIIIDLQNFTLSSALRKDLALPMREAEEVLLKFGIPAARKAKIQIIWLNWGLTDKDLESLPPIYFRNFGWKSNNRDADYGITFRNKGTASADGFVQWGESREATAPGHELGQIALEDGTTIDAGRVLFKDTWNAALHDPLAATFKESQNSPLPDVLFHKNRNSGMCDAMTDCTDYLRHKGIRTLLFLWDEYRSVCA